MGEHLVVKDEDRVRVGNTDALSSSGEQIENGKKATEVVEGIGASSSNSKTMKEKELAVEEEEEGNEEVPLIGGAECRICQDEDSLNNLESPCACCGSLKVKFSVFTLLFLALLLANLIIGEIDF